MSNYSQVKFRESIKSLTEKQIAFYIGQAILELLTRDPTPEALKYLCQWLPSTAKSAYRFIAKKVV
jgi:hypothetical protein